MRLPSSESSDTGKTRRTPTTSEARHRQVHTCSTPTPRPTYTLSPAYTMFATARRLPLVRPVASRRLFHASAPAFVNVGDKLPDVELVEGSPGNKVNLAKELTGKGVIIGN